jgi:ribosomal protein S18 acetylase RimI-like enzyme
VSHHYAAIDVEDPLLGSPDADILDNAAWTSLTGAHARFAETHGQAARYAADVAPFAAISPNHDERVWEDVAAVVGPGGVAALSGGAVDPPPGWEIVGGGEGVQMIGTELRTQEDPEAIELGAEDVPEMLALIARTKPGPFLPRTIELGRYLGIRRGGALVAMAGERLHPPGWTEISAVCTDSGYRGQGLATRLVRAVGAGIRARGETPLLHAAGSNTNAIRLYAEIGFVLRRRTVFRALRVPAG